MPTKHRRLFCSIFRRSIFGRKVSMFIWLGFCMMCAEWSVCCVCVCVLVVRRYAMIGMTLCNANEMKRQQKATALRSTSKMISCYKYHSPLWLRWSMFYTIVFLFFFFWVFQPMPGGFSTRFCCSCQLVYNEHLLVS